MTSKSASEHNFSDAKLAGRFRPLVREGYVTGPIVGWFETQEALRLRGIVRKFLVSYPDAKLIVLPRSRVIQSGSGLGRQSHYFLPNHRSEPHFWYVHGGGQTASYIACQNDGVQDPVFQHYRILGMLTRKLEDIKTNIFVVIEEGSSASL